MTRLTTAQMEKRIAELESQNAVLAKPTGGLTCQKTAKGTHIYFRHGSFKEWTEKGGKTKDVAKYYTASFNLPLVTARALFTNPELMKEISAIVGAMDLPVDAKPIVVS